MAISSIDFDYIARLARDQAAIVLEAGKEYLVETRLAALAGQEGFASASALIEALRTQPLTSSLHQKTLASMTTNETLFFRDVHPFEALRRTILPEILRIRAEARQLSIWSAASSTGQEPYSLAMLIREHFPQTQDWRISILGTDLSPNVLKVASQGAYSQLEVNRGLPASYLVKYFTQQGGKWVIKDEIRKMVEFRPMNLIQPWPMMSGLDLIFIRNVMIYFDLETKKNILRRARGCLLPHGLLFLGSAETTLNIDAAFQPVNVGKTVVYATASAIGRYTELQKAAA